MRAEYLLGAASGSTGAICVGPCVSLRVHVIANGTGTGTVIVNQGETNVVADMKATQTITNPAAGANWMALSPSDWLEVNVNLSVGALKKVVVASVDADAD